MSAIWGAINLKGGSISENEIQYLKKPFELCIIDRIEEKKGQNYYMGCGIQYFTKEAKKEQLPFENSEQSIMFDADVILDNRSELYSRIQLSEEEKSLPDGMLLYRMFHQYGKECLNELLGAYAFVYYDKKTSMINMVVDCVGTRCIYYIIKNGIVYYSTLIKSLLAIIQNRKINERWISDFLIMDDPSMFTESEETPVEGIYRVAPAQIVTFSPKGVQKETYWSPEQNRKEIHYSSDEEYKNEFQSIYKEAVNCVLRSQEETSIMLSGGLDSTSVACIAARTLKEEGKNLLSYTSTPIKGYQSEHSKYWVVDETEDVIKTKEYLGNLDCKFIDLSGTNLWEVHNKQLASIEFPYKAVENILWMEEVMKQSYSDGARIMLSGAFGNMSVSFSDSDLYLQQLLDKGHFISFIKQFQIFWKKYHFSRKSELSKFLKNWIFNKPSMETKYDKTFVKEEAVEKYNCKHRLEESDQLYKRATKNYEIDRAIICSKVIMRQIGEFETKFSLMTGTILRDPTRDKRVIEFCVNLPLDQFVKNGEERRLISVYLRDFMPEHVFNDMRRGMQSADLKYRILRNWKSLRNKWMEIYKKNIENEVVDCRKAMKELAENESGDGMDSFDIARQFYTILCLEYEKELETM